jgi:hypothetical protein
VSIDDLTTPTQIAVDPATNRVLVQVVGGFQSGLITETYDYVGVAYPGAVTEVYTFKDGGSGGTTVATITVVYTDSTKDDLSTVTKT